MTVLLASLWLAATAPKVAARPTPTAAPTPEGPVGSIRFEPLTQEERKHNENRWLRAEWRWRYVLPPGHYSARVFIAWGRWFRREWQAASGPKIDFTIDQVPLEGELLLDLPWTGRKAKVYFISTDRKHERYREGETFLRSWHVRVVPDAHTVRMGEEVTLGDVLGNYDHDRWEGDLRVIFRVADTPQQPDPRPRPEGAND